MCTRMQSKLYLYVVGQSNFIETRFDLRVELSFFAAGLVDCNFCFHYPTTVFNGGTVFDQKFPRAIFIWFAYFKAFGVKKVILYAYLCTYMHRQISKRKIPFFTQKLTCKSDENSISKFYLSNSDRVQYFY